MIKHLQNLFPKTQNNRFPSRHHTVKTTNTLPDTGGIEMHVKNIFQKSKLQFALWLCWCKLQHIFLTIIAVP